MPGPTRLSTIEMFHGKRTGPELSRCCGNAKKSR
jgi:hypothetical protein